MSPYTELAEIYDLWQTENNPKDWVNYTEKLIKKHCYLQQGDGKGGSLIVADLGCGTGSIAIEMASRGYDVLGIDESMEMLSIAMDKNIEEKVCFICQDITKMELFGTADVMLCLLDTVNHLTTTHKLNAFFKMCKRYLNVGGILIFDVVTAHYFSNVLHDRIFSETTEARAIIWENSFNIAKGINTAMITVFTDNGTGLYDRADTLIKEKVHEELQIVELALLNGLTMIKTYADFTMNEPGPLTERIFYVLMNQYDVQKEEHRKRTNHIEH